MTSFPRGIIILLAVVLCSATATATLDVEEKQKEEKSRESARKPWNEDVADGTPEKPQNFLVISQSSDSIMEAWDKPADGDDVHYFVYVENEDMDDTTSLFFYTWEGLEACTNYTLGVRAVTSKGDMSEPALQEGQTSVGIPPEPQDLHVEKYTYTTVMLAWKEPDTLCHIEHYKVKYKYEESQPQEIQVSETTVEVSDLLPNTMYTFSVYASTTEGEGLAATVEQTTALNPPGPPENLVAEGISSTAIKVSWSAPTATPLYYIVTSVPCMYDVKVVYDLTYLMEGLKPCQLCYITVNSYYEDDDSEFPARTSATPDIMAPPPPINCVVEVKEQYIKVSWERPSTPCVLGTYNVSWTWKQLWGNGEEESDTLDTPALSQTVNKLRPYHLYTFEIAASIDGTFGSPTSCSGTSLESPAGPPVHVSVESGEQGMAQVTWDSPAEENGEILQYGIYENNGESLITKVSGNVHSTPVSLAPCVSVGISVRALNNAGWGEQSEVKQVTVVDDVLPKELRCPDPDPEVQVCWEPFSTTCPVSQYNLKWEGDVLWSDTADSNTTTLEWSEDEICYNISSTPYTNYSVELSLGTKLDQTIQCSSTTPMAAPGPPTLEELQTDNLLINVNWREPEEKNGVIINYLVEWMDWNGVDGSKSTDGNTSSSQIMELSCGGKVDVTVRAKTVEFGEKSPTQSVFIVNSISNLKCKNTKPGVIALSWDVNDSDCPIDMYNVTWNFESLWSDDNGTGWQQLLGDDLDCLVEHLLPFSEVLAEVHVDNSPSQINCSTTTLEEPSSPPTEVQQIANDTKSVTVSWSSPEFVRGRLIGWQLNWKTSTGENIGTEKINDPKIMTFQIQGLSPSGKYDVEIMALNGAGEGEPSTLSVTTVSSPPESYLGLILGVSIGGGIVLILLAVGGVIIYNKKHKTRSPRSAPFMPGVINSDDNDKLYKKQHQSAANQRFQGKSGTIDFGTNRELYPNNDKAREPLEEMVVMDEIIDGHNTVPGNKEISSGLPGDRRLSLQVSSSLPKMAAYNRRASQGVNMRMRTFEEYNRRSSQQDLTGTSELGMHGGKPNVGESGRRPSQQIDLGRPNFKEFGRRPSQQIDVRQPNPMEHGKRLSQQIDQERPRLGEYGRRPSQQIDLGRPILNDYGRRPSQQIDMRKPRSGEYARRPSQQVDIGGKFLPSPSPQQPINTRPAYDHYRRRPSQQAEISMPSDRAFMRRPSQQFVTNFDGIQE